MLSEVENVRQVRDEGYRRWFTDSFFDLIVWYEQDGSINGFQLCYDKFQKERALTWLKNKGFSHEKIDDGEIPGHSKMTPILVPDGEFSKESIAEKFKAEAKEIDPQIKEFIYTKISRYPL